MKSLIYICLSIAVLMSSCSQSGSKQKLAEKAAEIPPVKIEAEMPLNTVNPAIAVGSIDRLSDELDQVIPPGSQIEIIAEGFIWSEGPVWLESENKLLFSDIPRNSIFQWSEADGLSLYMDSAGYSGPAVGMNVLFGSNGLLLDAEENLILCQHGNRQIAKMDAPLDKPEINLITITDNYQGKKFNSPNDAVYNSKGDLYFTDPPYGLAEEGDDPLKELDFQGVYKLSASGELTLLDDELLRPNGIGLSPDEKTLYVGCSDPENPVWKAYSLDENGIPTEGHILFDASEYAVERPDKGLPDGLTVNKEGYLFGTGPGGIYVFSPKEELIGFINTEHANGNCTLDADESTLYIAADMFLMRVKLK